MRKETIAIVMGFVGNSGAELTPDLRRNGSRTHFFTGLELGFDLIITNHVSVLHESSWRRIFLDGNDRWRSFFGACKRLAASRLLPSRKSSINDITMASDLNRCRSHLVTFGFSDMAITTTVENGVFSPGTHDLRSTNAPPDLSATILSYSYTHAPSPHLTVLVG